MIPHEYRAHTKIWVSTGARCSFARDRIREENGSLAVITWISECLQHEDMKPLSCIWEAYRKKIARIVKSYVEHFLVFLISGEVQKQVQTEISQSICLTYF